MNAAVRDPKSLRRGDIVRDREEGISLQVVKQTENGVVFLPRGIIHDFMTLQTSRFVLVWQQPWVNQPGKSGRIPSWQDPRVDDDFEWED